MSLFLRFYTWVLHNKKFMSGTILFNISQTSGVGRFVISQLQGPCFSAQLRLRSFTHSHHVHVGFLELLQIPPTFKKHAHIDNKWHLGVNDVAPFTQIFHNISVMNLNLNVNEDPSLCWLRLFILSQVLEK